MRNRRTIYIFFTIVMLIAVMDVFSQNKSIVKPDTAAKASKSDLKSKVSYDSRDSMRLDMENQKLFLYGDAKVLYEEMKLQAGYIEFDMLKNIAYAHGAKDSVGNSLLDSVGMPIGDPVFTDGSKSFDAKELTYNFKTKKGKIREVTTQEGDAFIHAKESKKDSGDVYYVKNGKYTTCNLDNPHFYLNATKLKIIPKDKIICGPANLVIEDALTPLAIPFGVFPNKVGRKSGILIPSYGESNLGFFLKDGGYYFGLSDYFDAALRGDFYSKGSYNFRENTNYAKRYKFNGNFGFNFSQIQISEKEFPDYSKNKTFLVRWQHSQDSKANPSTRFSANVNAGSSSYQKYNSTNANDYLSNSMNSNISWSKAWRWSNLSMNMSHGQNTSPRADKKGNSTTVDITAPELAFTTNRFYPFKQKNQVGKAKVYEKIGASFSVNSKNQISTYDSLLFQPSAINKLRNGLQASVPLSTSMNIGPIIMSPSVNFNSVGYFQSYQKRYGKSITNTDSLITDTLKTFKSAYDLNFALAFSTKIYGMFSFKHGRIKAIRHVMTPSASFGYRPDYSEAHYRYYYNLTDSKGEEKQYSIFENAVYGYPPSGKYGAVNLSLNNNLEMKVRPSQKDTSSIDKKVILIDNFTIASSYNIALEHFKWSNISLTGHTRLFKVADITLTSVIDPYAIMYDSLLKHEKRIDRFQYNLNGKIGRLTSSAISLSTSLRSLVDKKDDKTKIAKTSLHNKNPDELNYILLHPDYYVDFNVPWNLIFNYNIVYSKEFLRDTIIQSFNFSGDLNITKKWKIGFRSGFDFVKKDFTFTSFDVYRDLHCWEMRLNWIPFGFRKSYMLTIAVKASTLQDLKLSRTRDWYDYN